MAIGRTNAGGGGSALNFKVIAVSSELLLPATAKENTIAVITDTAITSYVFSADTPTPEEGMIWFTTETSSVVSFDAIKKNVLRVYPTNCQQYTSGGWVKKAAKTWQNGAWVEWWDGYYYKEGNEEVIVTGGWNTYTLNGVSKITLGSTEISFDITYQSDSGYGAILCTRNKIPIKKLKTLIVKKSCAIAQDAAPTTRAGFGLLSTAKYVSPAAATNWVSYVSIGATQQYWEAKTYTETRLDVSSVQGDYYIALGNEYSSAYARDGGSRMWVPQIWGEVL